MPEFKCFEDTVDVEQEQEVEVLIETYAGRLMFAQTASKQLVLEAYRVEKPLTGPELFGQDEAVIMQFTDGLSESFLSKNMRTTARRTVTVERFFGRLKNLLEIAVMLDRMEGNYCDIGGLLYGIPLEHVAGYSRKHGNFK